MTDETATNRQQQAENAVNDKEDEQRQSAEKDVAAEGDDKATDNTDDSTKEPSVEEQLEEAQLKIAELNDKYLRLMAEFDNYRKRVMKEKSELIKTAGTKVITTILPVLDDMERAEQNMEKAEDVEALKEGVQLIFDKFLKLLATEGLKVIDTTDKVFDTDFHEAVAMVPGQPDELKGKVIDCIQTGYTLNDKVIRHAKVAVAQ
ncbi:MAG: nucleotide exchange factor GrpE [Bacteroidaceae bacterium]|nr:nucleotide exchange factor GrpE [Bacteroidaceae bacterium]